MRGFGGFKIRCRAVVARTTTSGAVDNGRGPHSHFSEKQSEQIRFASLPLPCGRAAQFPEVRMGTLGGGEGRGKSRENNLRGFFLPDQQLSVGCIMTERRLARCA